MKQKLHKMEDEASMFAFCLLMPESMIRYEIEKLEITDIVDCNVDIIGYIADKFRVTRNVAAIRINQLGIFEEA